MRIAVLCMNHDRKSGNSFSIVLQFFAILNGTLQSVTLGTRIVFSGITETTGVATATIRPSPVTRAPITSRPISQNPVTLTPTTTRPTTFAPVVAPLTISPTSPTSTSQFPLLIRYEVSFRNGNTGSGIDDLVASLNLLAPQVMAETFPTTRDRRRLVVTVELPTRVTETLNTRRFYSCVNPDSQLSDPLT